MCDSFVPVCLFKSMLKLAEKSSNHVLQSYLYCQVFLRNIFSIQIGLQHTGIFVRDKDSKIHLKLSVIPK